MRLLVALDVGRFYMCSEISVNADKNMRGVFLGSSSDLPTAPQLEHLWGFFLFRCYAGAFHRAAIWGII